jgi:hypothetical protein
LGIAIVSEFHRYPVNNVLKAAISFLKQETKKAKLG